MGGDRHRRGRARHARGWALGLCVVLLAVPGAAAGNKLAFDLGDSAWQLPGFVQSVQLKLAGAGKSKFEQPWPGMTDLTLGSPGGSWELRRDDQSLLSGDAWRHKSPSKRRARLRTSDTALQAFATQLVDQHVGPLMSFDEQAEVLSSKGRCQLTLEPAEDGSTTATITLRVNVKGRLTSPSGKRKFRLRVQLTGRTLPVSTVSIGLLPAPPYLPVDALFVFSPVGSSAPLTVYFGNQSTGTITAHHWSFGQGQESSLPNPTMVYPHPGEYAVALRVSGPLGSAEFTEVVKVEPGLPQPTKKQYLHYEPGDTAPSALYLRDMPMSPAPGVTPAIGLASGEEAVFRRILPAQSNNATFYSVSLRLLVQEPITLRWELALVDVLGGERILLGPKVETYPANSAYFTFSYGSADGPLMNGQPGDTLELRLANVSPPSTLLTPFSLSMPGSFVTVPDF